MLKSEPSINTLVVVNDSELQAFTKEEFPHTASYSTGNINSYSGYRSGLVAGNDINFKRGMGSGGSVGPALLKS